MSGGGGWGEEGGRWVSVYPASYLRYTLLFLPNPWYIPLIMLWGKTQLYSKERSWTPVDRLFDSVLLPFTIVVKFVVAGKRNQTSETNAEWEKNLWCSIDPNLKYNKNSVYVKKGNMTVLLCKVCNHVTRRPCWYSRERLEHATCRRVFVENGEKKSPF